MDILFLNQLVARKFPFPAQLDVHLGVEATGRLQEQRQVGLDLAAVGIGAVLGLALQGGDLVLKGMIPPEGRQHTMSQPASPPQPITVFHLVRRLSKLTSLAPPSCREHTLGLSLASSGTGPAVPAWTSTPLPSPAWSLTQTGSKSQLLDVNCS